MVARPVTARKPLSMPDAKAEVLRLIADGWKVGAACKAVGRSEETYRDWRKNDFEFKRLLAEIRTVRKVVADGGRPDVPDFDEFCREFLFEPLFPHQYNMWDAIEGRTPRYLDPAMQWDAGDPGRIVINIPPNHAKTTTFSINYVVWLIHKNPGVSIAIVSKSQGYAKKILSAIKSRLTDKKYRNMHLRFAPDGGWRDPDTSWNLNMIYVQGKYDGDTEKEPTVEAVGMQGHIYGGRFDKIIMDDVVDSENAHRFDVQSDWTMTEVESRLPPHGGQLIVLGTRLAALDLYGDLRSKCDEDEQPYFTYFAQPAVLEFAADRHGWRTLWPYQTTDEEDPDASWRCLGCYGESGECGCGREDFVWMKPRWTGAALSKRRFPLGERRWSLVWMQHQVPDDATFNGNTVRTSINRSRQIGPLKVGAMGHRPKGMEGLYVVGGLDPATIGFTAMMVVAIDRVTEKRWVLDGFNRAGTSPATMRAEVKRLTDTYKINEWVIERNAFQKFLTDDPELRQFLQSRGCKLTAHYTTDNKVDPDFGVMSMAPLFESTGRPPKNQGGAPWSRVQEGDLIELPDERNSALISALVSQLIAWEPRGLSSRQKTDLVMALWFCEIAMKRIVSRNRQVPHHMENKFASRGRLKSRAVVNLAEWRAELLAEKERAA